MPRYKCQNLRCKIVKETLFFIPNDPLVQCDSVALIFTASTVCIPMDT